MVNFNNFSTRNNPSIHMGRANIWNRYEQRAAQQRDIALFYNNSTPRMNYGYNWFQPFPQNTSYNAGYATGSVANGFLGMFKNWFSSS